MTRFLLSLLLVLSTGPALAQQRLPVRSAEHPEYSRLLVSVSSQADWVLSREGRSVTVTFIGLRASFLLDDVFSRMPRTRIVAVTGRDLALGAALELTLACSCDVDINRVGSRFVAIDVRRGASNQPEGTARRVLNPFSSQPQDPASSDGNVSGQPGDGIAERVLPTAPTAAPAAVSADGTADDAPAPQPTPATPGKTGVASIGGSARPPIDTVRSELLAQLQRAADEGLIELDAPLPETQEEDAAESAQAELKRDNGQPGDQERPENVVEEIRVEGVPETGGVLDTESYFEPASLGGAIATATPDIQISTRTPLDRPASTPPQTVPVACPKDEDLDVNIWTDGSPMPEQLGRLRRALVSETGTLDRISVSDLAKYYILIGFGREAEYILALTDDLDDRMSLLADLARAVEGRPAKEQSVLAHADSCPGRTAMWRLVAGFNTLETSGDPSQDVIDAFSELPPDLRRIAGSQIARHALAAGHPATAEGILRILDRTPGEVSSSEKAQRARLASFRSPQSVNGTQDIVQPEPAGANRVEFLLMQAEALLDARQEISDLLMQDLEIEARLARGRPEGLEIALTLARLEYARRDPSAAFGRLAKAGMQYRDKTPQITRVAQEMLSDLENQDLPPALMARLILENFHYLGNDRESVTLRETLAKALMDRGLPNSALSLLDGVSLLPDARARLFRAEVLLAVQQPLAALKLLEGRTDDANARLISRAHLALDSFQDAYAALEDLPTDNIERNRLALLSKNFDDVERDGLPDKLRAFADVVVPGGGGQLSNGALNVSGASEADDVVPSLAGLQENLIGASMLRSAVEATATP